MSTLKVNTLEEATAGGATFFTAKVWCNWEQVGTHSILGSGNVSSLTDGGTGITTTNFSSSLSTSAYSMGLASGQSSNDPYRYLGLYTGKTTSSVQTATIHDNVARYDAEYNSITVVL